MCTEHHNIAGMGRKLIQVNAHILQGRRGNMFGGHNFPQQVRLKSLAQVPCLMLFGFCS